MEYFYTPPHHIAAPGLTIDGDEFVHLTHVMRKQPGDAIRVADGAGTTYDVIIREISKRTARCEVTATHARLNEPDIDVTLGVALLKNASKFDFLVEKVTELGVNTIVPLLTERTIPRHAKVDRWQKLALAAMKQSGRCVLPKVHELASLHDFMRMKQSQSRGIIFHEKEIRLLQEKRFEPGGSVVLLIGPEGGFTDEEVSSAVRGGCTACSLGPRRLRTETAAIVASARILADNSGETIQE